MENDAVHEWFKKNGYKPTAGSIVEYCELKEPAMANKPTREDVLERYRLLWDDLNSYEMTERLTFIRDAYLAQEAELEGNAVYIQRLDKRLSFIEDWNFSLLKNQVALEVANQTLKTELERKGRLIKLQDGFITEKSRVAAERSTVISELDLEIGQLKAENQALKAGTFHYAEPKQGEPLPYPLDEEDTLP